MGVPKIRDNPTNMDLGVPLGNLDIIFHSFQFPYPLVNIQKAIENGHL